MPPVKVPDTYRLVVDAPVNVPFVVDAVVPMMLPLPSIVTRRVPPVEIPIEFDPIR